MKTSPLRIERTRQGLSQSELSEQTKVSRVRISMYESGVLKLREDELRRLREILKGDFANPIF